MRVALVDSGIAVGGTLIMAANISRGLHARHGHAVTAVVSVSVELAEPYFAGAAQVRHLRIPYNYVHSQALKGFFRVGGPLGGILRPLGLVADTAVRQVNRLYKRRLASLLREIDPDVVHINNGVEAIAAVPEGCPIVYHLHGPFAKTLPDDARREFERVSHFIAISSFVRGTYIATGMDPSKVSIVNNFVMPRSTPEVSMLAARQSLGLPAGGKLVGLVGRVVPWKGTREFTASMIEVMRHDPGVNALVVGDPSEGDGSYYLSIREMIRASGMQDRFWFISHVQEPYFAYRACDVVAHASIEPEPFGMVIIEAMQAGVAVVAAATGGGPAEIITDGVNGSLADPRDVVAYAGAITPLLANDELRHKIAAAGFDLVAKSYGPGPSTDAIIGIYSRAIESRT